MVKTLRTYHVIMAMSVEDIEQAVSELMAEGWRPTGGVHVLRYQEDAHGRVRYEFSQAMYREPISMPVSHD